MEDFMSPHCCFEIFLVASIPFFVTFCFLCCQLSRLGATVTIQPETKPVAIPQPEAIEEIQVQTEQEPVPVHGSQNPTVTLQVQTLQNLPLLKSQRLLKSQARTKN
jgi:hypothetical protein